MTENIDPTESPEFREALAKADLSPAPVWMVRVEAFGRVSQQKVRAATRREAEEKRLAEIGFKISSSPIRQEEGR